MLLDYLGLSLAIIYLMFGKLTKTYLGATIPLVNVTGVITPQL